MSANPKREPQVLVVTSALPGEGKTTTVINLGLSLVEVKANRVLLIDGCLPRGGRTGRRTLSGLLKLQSESGLAELLATPEQDGQGFIKATPWHHLFVLPAGIHAIGASSTELLKSAALRQRLRQLRGNFDWVLIDAPAALSLPDAGLLGGVSDGIVLAAALHHTAREKVQTAIRRLKSLNLAVKSCILTRG
jgi:receptor protein-tyrosine kinase